MAAAAAAAAAAAPAAPAPVLVSIPAFFAADPIYVFESASEVVVNTPCLPWRAMPPVAGAPARSGLPLSLVLKNFFARTRVGPAAADEAAAQVAPILETLPSAALVSKVLTEYRDSGLFRSQFVSPLELEAALESLTLGNPANMDITAPDFLFGESFDTPRVPAVPAQRGRGGRAAVPASPAVPAAPGPASLRFLSLVTVYHLFKPELPDPLGAWARLAGILGPVWTQSIRATESSQVRTMASVIVPNINKYLGCVAAAAAPDATMAMNMADFLAATRLPLGLRPSRQDGNFLTKEALDGFRYRLGSVSDREAVEGQRIPFLRSTAPTFATYFTDRCSNPLDAADCERRLSSSLLSTERRGATLVDRIVDLEMRLVARRPLMDSAISTAGGAISASQLVSIVLAEATATAPTIGAASTPTAAAAGAPSQPPSDSLREDAIQAALLSTSFRQAVLDIAGISDSTSDGRRAVLDAAFSSGSIIIIRLLAYGSAALAKRHPLLAKLLNLRSELPAYFSYCQVVQANGTLTPLAEKWSWVDRTGADDTQLRLFLRQQYSKMNWIDAPHGVLGRQAVLNGSTIDPLDALDRYVVLSVLEELQDFGERTLAAFGVPTNVPASQGYTWRSFIDFYIAHLKFAKRLASVDEQHDWLSKADEAFNEALQLMGAEVRRVVESDTPASAAFGAILPVDAPPIKSMRAAQTALETLVAHREQWSWMRPAQSTSVRADELPKRSQDPRLKQRGSSAGKRPARSRSPTPPRAKKVSFAGGEKKVALADSEDSEPEPEPQRVHFFWLQPSKLLFVSGRVWNVIALAKHLGVQPGAKCWPVALSRRTDANRLLNCEKRGKSGHESVTSAAHKLTQKIDDLTASFARVPNADERRRLVKVGAIAEAGTSSRSPARSARGRGRGRGNGKPSGK